jgi:hypothetical protein
VLSGAAIWWADGYALARRSLLEVKIIGLDEAWKDGGRFFYFFL